MLDADLLAMLCCPENGEDLTEATPEEIESINLAIAAGKLSTRAGTVIIEKVDGALVRQDRAWIYPVRDDIPIMLIDESIPGTALSARS